MRRRGVVLMFMCAGLVLGACGNVAFSVSGNGDGGVDASSNDGSSSGNDAATDGDVTGDGAAGDAGPDHTIMLIDNQDNPHDLIIQNGHLYWTNYSETLSRGSIGTALTDGSQVTTIGTATHANRLASDGASIFWTDYVSDTFVDSVLGSVQLDGGLSSSLTGDLVAPMGLAVDDQFIYMAEYFGYGGAGTISVFTKDGSFQGNLASSLDNPISVAVDTQGVVWTQLGVTAESGEVIATDLDGGITGLASGRMGAWGLAMNNSTAFVTELVAPDASVGGTISSFARAGGTAQFLANSTAARPYFITADATNIYWTEEGNGPANGSVRWMPQSGGPTHAIASGQLRPHGIAVDATHVYWTSYSGGKIYRSPKP